MAPRQPRSRLCLAMSEIESGLISGISSGTSSSMRCAAALEKTSMPRRAHSGSTSRATAVSSAEKTIAHGSSSVTAATVIEATDSGSFDGSRQRDASP